MNNKHSDIEKLFRERFKDFELPVSDLDFAAIEDKLATKTKKRRGFWLPVLLVAAAAGLGIAWYTGSQKGVKHNGPLDPTITSRANTEEVQKRTTQKYQNNSVPAEQIHSDHLNLHDKLSVQGSQSQMPARQQRTSEKLKDKTSYEHEIIVKNVLPHGFSLLLMRSKTPRSFVTGQNRHEMPELKDKSIAFAEPISEDPEHGPEVLYSAGILFTGGSSAPQFSSAQNDNAQISYREFTEQNGSYQEYGLNFAAQRKTWVAGTGLHWQQLQTQTTSFKIQLYDSIPVLNPQGDTLGYFRLNIRDSIGQATWNNNYQYLSIPITVSRSIRINAKNALILGAGGTFQYLLNAEGTIIGSGLKTEPLNASTLQKSLQQWNVQLGYERNITPNIRLQLSYIHQQNISPLTRNLESVQMRMQQNGIRFNISYTITPR